MNEITWPKITKDTTIEELREIHKRIWLYAAEHGEKPKTPYIENCVLCEWDAIFGNNYCIMCPYIERNLDGICLNGLYGTWFNANYFGNSKKARNIALQIANLELIDRRNG